MTHNFHLNARLLFVGARNGHFPQALSLISVNRFTPTPALVFLVSSTSVISFLEIDSMFLVLPESPLLVHVRHFCPDRLRFFCGKFFHLALCQWSPLAPVRQATPRSTNQGNIGFLYFKICDSQRTHSQVPLFLPIVFLFLCAFLVFLPVYVRPKEVGMGILITLTGIPFYLLFVWWVRRPQILRKISGILTVVFQKLFYSAYQDNQNEPTTT